MVRVHLYDPDEEIPIPPPIDEKALYFSPSTRAEFLQQMVRHARRERGHLFIAEENDKLVAQGVTQFHRVISITESGAIRLSESHASHQSPQPLDIGHSYELAIDPASSEVLYARDLGEQDLPEPATARYKIDPVQELPDLGKTAVAKAFFSRVQRQPHIPFQFPGNGCWARAHEMCRLIEHHLDRDPRNVVAKVWNPAVRDGDLIARTNNNPRCKVRWFYHVAPVVKAANELLVLDPAFFEGPVSVRQWLSRQEGASTGPIFTTLHAYKWHEEELFLGGEPGIAETDLRRFRDELISQIYCHGPLPYPCARLRPPLSQGPSSIFIDERQPDYVED